MLCCFFMCALGFTHKNLAAPRTTSVPSGILSIHGAESSIRRCGEIAASTLAARFFVFIFKTQYVFVVHRVGMVWCRRGDFKKAEKQLADCRTAAEGLLPLINETPRLRMGSFSCSMEVRAGVPCFTVVSSVDFSSSYLRLQQFFFFVCVLVSIFTSHRRPHKNYPHDKKQTE